MEKTITIVTDNQYRLHDTGGGEHPEVPERLDVINSYLHDDTLAEHIEVIAPRAAERREVLAFHQESWLLRFEEAALAGRSHVCHTDNQICYESYGIALLSAGAGLTAIDRIEQDGAGIIFCANRPPGHHAEPAQANGFCFFNNCVIAARYWQKTYNRQRICIVDFDAHHGNGIQTAFENDSDSLYISIHEDPRFSYPGTGWPDEIGIDAGAGTIVNIPLALGAGDREILAALDGQAGQHIKEFRPEALIIAAGFDGHRLDDMSGLNYSTALYGQIGQLLGRWSRELCQGRAVSILEGGYHLPSLGESVAAYLHGFSAP